MDPSKEASDDEAASPPPADDDEESDDFDDDDEDDPEESYSARAQPPSRSRSPIEVELLSSDDDEDDGPVERLSSQTVPVSSSPLASQKSEEDLEEEDEDVDEEEEDIVEDEEMEQEDYESDGSVNDDDEPPLQISEQDPEPQGSEADPVEEAGDAAEVDYEFSKPFEPMEPLDLPVMDPVTQDLMDSVEELKALPDHVLSKLTNLWATKNSELRSLQEKLSASGDASNSFEMAEFGDVADSPVEQTVDALNGALEKKRREAKILLMQRDSARQREKDSVSQLNRKDEEVQRVVTENTALSTQLSQAIASKCEALVKLQQIERKEMELQNKEWRMDNENASLKANCSHLSERLDSTMRQLTQTKHEMSMKITDLEIMLRDSKAECERSEAQIAAQKESLLQYEQQVEKLQESLREARDSAISLHEVHSQEIQAKAHMARLYQEQAIDAQKLGSSYLAIIEELRDTVKNTAEKYGDLETRLELDKANYECEIENKNKMIVDLRKELQSANELLEKYNDAEMDEQVAALAPSGSCARKMVQTNLSYTEMYKLYKQNLEELELANKDREVMNQSMQSIVKELEMKAPVYAKDREQMNSTAMENERLVESYDKMSEELQNVTAEAQQAKKTSGLLKRNNDRMQTQIDDLSRQNVILLREIEILKSQRPSPRFNMNQSLDLTSLSPSAIVTERLLPFRDIEELQTRNMELLASVRELTAQAEAAEQAKDCGLDIVKLSEQLDGALSQMKSLREKEGQHEFLIQQLTEQRNHFREMCQHNRSSHDVGVSPMKSEPSPIKRLPSLTSDEEKELKIKLLNVQEALARTTKQFDDLIKENNEKVKELEKKLEKAAADSAEKNILIVKLKAVVENREGKLSTAVNKTEDLKKQVEALETKSKAQAEQLTAELRKRQEMLNELHNTRTNLNRSEVALTRMRTELDSAKARVETLKQECDTWKKSSEERGSIQASVEQMRMALERTREEGKDILLHQLKESRIESERLRKRLQEESQRLNDELVQLQSALEAERAKVISTQAEVASAKNETGLVEERLAAAQRDVQALRAHRNPSVDSSSQTEVFVSEEAVREKRMAQRALEFEVNMSTLRSELALAKSRSVEYKNVADATERSLVKLKEALRISEEKNGVDKSRWEASEMQLKAKIVELERDLAETRAKVQTASAEATQQLEVAKKQLAESMAEMEKLQLAVDESQVTKSLLNAAEEEGRRLSERLAAETEHNMRNMQANAELKNQMEAAMEERATLTEDLERFKCKVTQLEDELQLKERQLTESSAGLQQDLQQIRDHNTALYNQLQTMSAELSALKHGHASDRDHSLTEGSSQLNLSISGDDSQSSEQLMQVVKFLRREKEAAHLQVDDLKTKLAEVKARLEAAEQQIEDQVHNVSIDAPEGPELVTRTRYEALRRQLETMSALNESAKLQREECSTLRKQNDELQARIKTLLEEATNLQAQTRRFEEKAGALQVDLALVKGEATRWRTCANQLTEKANQANPEELRRLLQERENLQKQLQMEREALGRERDEAKRLREALGGTEQQLATTSAELAQLKTEFTRVSGEHASLTAVNKELTDRHRDLVSKELTVRRIAKKYKTQFDQLTAEVKQKEQSAASEANSAQTELQTKLQELEASEAEHIVKIDDLQQKVMDLTEQIAQKEGELTKIQTDVSAQKEKEEKMRLTLVQARSSLAEKQKLLDDCKARNAALTEEINKALVANEEMRVRNAALQSQYEARNARAEKELQEIRPLAEAYVTMTQQTSSQAEAPKHPEEHVQQLDSQQGPSDAKSLTRTANVPPLFTARGRGQGQAAAVTPVSRVGTPMALLRPMKASQGQAPVTDVVGESSGVAARAQPLGARAAPRATEVVAPVLESEIVEDAPSTSGNVQLVRPHELHVAAGPSQPAPPQPPASSQPILKRAREAVEAPSSQTDEPQAKMTKSEVPSESVEEVDVEEPPSTQATIDPEEVALRESEDECQVVDLEGENEDDIMEEEEEDEEEEKEEIEEEDNEGLDEENDGDDDDDKDGVLQELNDEEDVEETNAEENLLQGDDGMLDQAGELDTAAEDAENDEVHILDDETSASTQNETQNAPVPTREFESPAGPDQEILVQPPQMSVEEVGDFGIVPSTPTLITQAPNVVTQASLLSAEAQSFVPRVAPTSPLTGAELVEVLEEPGRGQSVPSNPSTQELPTITVEDVSAPDVIEEIPSLASVVSLDSAMSRGQGHSLAMRGPNRARRSGGNFGPGRARGSGRPAPITWNQPEGQQQFRGRSRPPRPPRARPTRGDPFHPLDFM